MTLLEGSITLVAVALDSALNVLATRAEAQRTARGARQAVVRDAVKGLVVTALSMPYIQQLLGTKAMRGHLRWRPAALDAYMNSADLKLERLLAAKTAVDLAEGQRVIDEAGRQPWRGAAEIATMTALTKTLSA